MDLEMDATAVFAALRWSYAIPFEGDLMTQRTLAPTTVTDPSPSQVDRLARWGLPVAVFGTLLAPIHALARYATEDGKEDLELAGPSVWAPPTRDVIEPILDWGSADTVYVTYGKGFLFLMVFVALAAFAVRKQRGDVHGAEKWGWRIAVPGFILLTAAMLGEFWSPWLEESFALLAVPGLLVSMIGCTVLGIALLRRGFRPRTSAVLLAGFIPLVLGLSDLISLGAPLVALVWAFALALRHDAA